MILWPYSVGMRGKSISALRRRGRFCERLPHGKEQASPRSDQNGGGGYCCRERPSPFVSATLLRETRHTKIGWMDLERSVLSTIPLAVAHEASGEVASVIDARSFLPADGRGVRLAAIEPSDENGVGSALAAKAAPQVLSTPARHELAATGHRICLRNAERDARNAGFALWGAPCDVVNQPGGWTDVPAEQERFAMVRGEVSP
jgi:hypothetical protein